MIVKNHQKEEIEITNATLADVGTLFRWGEENKYLWTHE